MSRSASKSCRKPATRRFDWERRVVDLSKEVLLSHAFDGRAIAFAFGHLE